MIVKVEINQTHDRCTMGKNNKCLGDIGPSGNQTRLRFNGVPICLYCVRRTNMRFMNGATCTWILLHDYGKTLMWDDPQSAAPDNVYMIEDVTFMAVLLTAMNAKYIPITVTVTEKAVNIAFNPQAKLRFKASGLRIKSFKEANSLVEFILENGSMGTCTKTDFDNSTEGDGNEAKKV